MKYVIYGLGISGISAAKFLSKAGNEVIVTDDNEKNIELSKEKLAGFAVKFLKADELVKEAEFDQNTVISVAPGIPLYYPKDHKIVELANKTGAKIACDIEIFYRQNKQNNFIAITGTNGKSTTTALTGFIFKHLGLESAVGGNIGIPAFELPTNSSGKANYIFETSSYQLDLMTEARFNVAALLNITPDHIDHHGSMEAYIEAKKRIFRNQAENDFALIGIDNDVTRKIYEDFSRDPNFKARLIPVSTKKTISNGISLIGGVLTNNIDKNSWSCELKSEFLHGEHNEQNIAFAFAAAFCSGVTDQEKIVEAILKFEGLPHRCKIVGKKNDVIFVNDSKATNAESTEPALKAYENIFWILGGLAKEGGISILKPLFSKVAKAYLIGSASDDFAKILESEKVSFEKCGDLENAFKQAVKDIKKSSLTKKVILLSPACASLDQWKNFEQRGDYFCKLVDEFIKS